MRARRAGCASGPVPSASIARGRRPFEDTLSRLGCDVTRGPLFHLSECGTKLSVTDEEGEYIPHERILALCALYEFKEGRTLPFLRRPQTIDVFSG